MATVDRSRVADLPLFAGLAAAELDDILRAARAVHHAKNSIVFEEGGAAESFFVLLHGHVRAAKTTPDGQQVVVRYVAPGEVFGVAMAIGLARYPATATAVDDSVVLVWPAANRDLRAGQAFCPGRGLTPSIGRASVVVPSRPCG